MHMIKRMKKCFSGVLAMALTLGMAACGSGSDKAEDGSGSGSGNEAVTGSIVIYTSMYNDIIEDIKSELKKEFPNLDVEFFQGGTGTIQSKVAAEKDAGKLGCDILMVAEQSYGEELKEQGMLHPHIFPDADKLAFEYDKEGYWYPVRSLNMVLAYNPEKYKEDEVPHSMKDFAENEKYKDIVEKTKAFLSSYYSDYSLELMATVDYILRNDVELLEWRNLDDDSVVGLVKKGLKKWSDRKAKKFNEDMYIKQVVGHLREMS